MSARYPVPSIAGWFGQPPPMAGKRYSSTLNVSTEKHIARNCLLFPKANQGSPLAGCIHTTEASPTMIISIGTVSDIEIL